MGDPLNRPATASDSRNRPKFSIRRGKRPKTPVRTAEKAPIEPTSQPLSRPLNFRPNAKLFLLLCTIACLALIACRWYAGVLPQMMFGHDDMVLLQGGWKWKWGFIPHRDFYSPFGALTFVLVACGGALGGMANALPAAVCLMAACLLPLALYATFTRMRPGIACLATIVIVAQAVAPHMLRFPASDWTYACIYNRWSYSLFCIALLLVAIPPLKCSRRKDVADACIAIICVTASIMIKISYGLLVALAALTYAIINRRTRAYYLSAAAMVIFSIIVAGSLIDWSFGKMLQDTSMAAHARSGLGIAEFFSSALYLYPELCSTVMLAGLCAFTLTDRGWVELSRTFALYGCCAGCAAAIIASNSPLGDLRESPLLSFYSVLVFAVIYNNCLTEDRSTTTPAGRTRLIPIIFLVGALILFIVIPASNSISLRAISKFSSRSLLAGEGLVCIVGWILVMTWPTKQKVVLVVFAGVLMATTALPSAGRNLTSLVDGVRCTAQNRGLPADQTFDSGGLKGMQINGYGGEPALPTSYVGKIDDGLELLRQQGEMKSVITVLDFANPFDVARGVKPCKGAPLCWQLDFVFSRTVAPPAQQVFDGVDAILIAKQFGDGNQENLQVLFQHYGGYLETNFVMAAQSQQWMLAKRKRN